MDVEARESAVAVVGKRCSCGSCAGKTLAARRICRRTRRVGTDRHRHGKRTTVEQRILRAIVDETHRHLYPGWPGGEDRRNPLSDLGTVVATECNLAGRRHGMHLQRS